MTATLICAVDKGFGFGYKNGLPWHCSTDLKHFARSTAGGVLIMGKSTWMSLPHSRILKTRTCIVVSTTLTDERVTVVPSIQEAFKVSSALSNVFVIGGPRLIIDCVLGEHVGTALITYVHGNHNADVLFAELEDIIAAYFKENQRTQHEDCTIVQYIHTAMHIGTTLELL